jgi:hypothetical protein
MLPIEQAIMDKLRSGPCCFDEVVTGLPDYSWGELFVAVDRMSRDRRVRLLQLGYSTYQISLGSQVASPVQSRVAEGEGASKSLEC